MKLSASAVPRLLVLFLACAVTAPAIAQNPTPSFSKTFLPNTIGPGSTSTLQFDITNNGSLPAADLAFTDNLPAGMTVADPARVTSDCVTASVTAIPGSGTISLADGSLGAFSSCTLTVDVTSATPGLHTNVSGDLTSSLGNSGNATADLTVATNRPGFSKSFSPGTVLFGGRSTLTFTIDNTANTAQATNLSFTDNLPTGMTVASPSNAATTCTGGNLVASPGGNVISYSSFLPGDAAVAAGASCTVSVDVIGGAVGRLGNTSGELTSTSGINFGQSSGKASASLTVTNDQISLTKSFVDDPAVPGGTVTLEFTVRNLDRRAFANNITFSDDLTAVLAGLEATGLPASGVCGAGSQLSGTTLLSLTGGNLAPEASCTFSVTLQMPADVSGGPFLNTTSAITADLDGRPVSGSPASDLLFVEAAPRLTKTFIGDPVGAGGSVDLEFTLTNTSPSAAATDITFEDVFVEELPTASAIPADGFCGAGSTATYTPLTNPPPPSSSTPARLVVSNASLAPGDSCTFSLTLDVAVGASTNTFDNTTSAITATVNGETVTGNPAFDSFDVVAAPALTKEFVDDPAQPGGTVTLELVLTHDENAPGNATDITFSDNLDATLTGLVATGLPQNDVCGSGSVLSGASTLLLTGGQLAPGESCTISVTLAVPSDATAGSHPNTTSAVSASVLGVATMGSGAQDDLRIAGLSLTKEFVDDPVLPGGTVTLRYTVENLSPTETATGIFINDNYDDAVNNMVATNLPLTDPCGAGSSMVGISANQVGVLQDGVLAPGTSCTFDVTLQVPASTPPDDYTSTTTLFLGVFGGATIAFDNANDLLVVANDFLALGKEFTNDPVSPGGNVNLRFTLTNLASETVSGIAFSDDLDSVITDLAATGLPSAACGGTVSGTSLISFSGGTLAAGEVCTFDVNLAVPASVDLGTTADNVTSPVTGTLGGLQVTGDPARDTLEINFLSFGKIFSGEASPGDVVQLSFTIQNLSASNGILELSFTDDLDAVLPGLAALGLPATDICGEGSLLEGTSFLAFSGGNLLPGGSCTFTVDVQVPGDAPAGSYTNVTSALTQVGATAADPATAVLIVIEEVDADGDGVLDGNDLCAGTAIPEGVPTQRLGTNRYALVDGDFIFDTNAPPGGGPGDVFTTTDTGGCSCEQIIEELDLGNGHRKFGCSLSAMRTWTSLVAGGELGGNVTLCGLHLLNAEVATFDDLLDVVDCLTAGAKGGK